MQQLKFEDFATDRNAEKLAEFLDVEIEPLKEAQGLVFNTDKSHMGHYKDIIPDWYKTFHPEAIKALRLLGYLGE